MQIWRRKLSELNEQEKKAVIWGGGSKGVSFLNFLEIHEQIKYVVDINPHKQGNYIPVTGPAAGRA